MTRIFEELKKSFDFIVAHDTEFKGDMKDAGELNDPVCSVYKDLKSGKVLDFKGKHKFPYPVDKTLIIAHNVGAEAHTLLSNGNKLPLWWWDTMIEDKKLNFGKVQSHGLLHCCKRYGIETISEDLKKYFINMILDNKNYSDDQWSQIIGYCQKDVEALENLFFKQLEQMEKERPLTGPRSIISQALFSGASMACTAKVEFNGMHVNNELLTKLQDNFPRIKRQMIKQLNNKLGVYDENQTLKYEKFYAMVERNELLGAWPITATGKLKTDDKTVFHFAQSCEDINDFYLLSEFVNSQKLKGFIVGPDHKARTPYFMYGLKTGRTNPSTSRHPFNAPKCMRNLIKPPPDKVSVNFDYKNQEIAIAAYLSGDPQLIAAVETGDPYIATARLVGAVPVGATKKSHSKERNLYKVTLLACLYRQGAVNMSKRMNINIDVGTEYQVKIKNIYNEYFRWIKPIVDRALLQGFLETKHGFRYYVNPGEHYNPRTFYNFPIQSHGSEMLRHALIGITKAGIELNALIHDGIVVTLDRKKFRKQFLKVKKIMEEASRKILNDTKKTNYICPVDWQVIRTGMTQDDDEQSKWDRIINIINTGTQGKSTGVHTQGETPIVTPGNNSALRVSLNNLNKYIYTV
jgi:DNA polymerase I-like protein with 3'-5' exonuclease and polymerase domains